MTLLELTNATAGYFEKKGVAPARLNAERLIAHVLKVRRLDLYLQFDRPMAEAELDRLRPLVRRRGEREPLQHILGVADFFGRDFACDARALVPRPETEGLIKAVLEHMGDTGRAWDIGTGSGVIAVTLALERPGWRWLASDVSAEALALARLNAERHGVAERITFVQADLAEGVGAEGDHLDWVVSNPPYLSTEDLARVESEVRADPMQALEGGGDGLEVIRRLVPVASRALEPGGRLALEIGEAQGEAVRALLQTAGWDEARIEQDLAGRDRVALGKWSGRP